MNTKPLALILCSLLSMPSFALDRGAPYEYDPGAPKDSLWPDYFANTPNYRAFGKAILKGNGEKFRWEMGPMWYRGRLTPSSVKVFVIGQEGAQDENVSNRSFTGSTGTRLQKFLQYLGVDRSYLFMNTFVYTINGQYTDSDGVNKDLFWLAQNEDSIIVKHRHAMFNYMLEQNSDTLALVIGVGTAGKDSALNWANSHGSNCTKSQMSSGYCLGKNELDGVVFIGVRHPGGASPRNGGASAAAAIRADFQKKADIVAKMINDEPQWFPADDKKLRNFSKKFNYGDAAVPHADFAFGTNWRMGKEGTSSNRGFASSIQVFSDDGKYGDRSCKYDVPKNWLNTPPKEMAAEDVPYESPKSKEGRRSYDEGPGTFAQSLIEYGTLNYRTLGATAHPSFGPQGMYRGRLDEASVLVIADQTSQDDMFSGRALTGLGGQKLQNFLEAMGIKSSYAIVRSLPVDTMDLSSEKQIEIALNEEVVDARLKVIQEVLNVGQTKLVLAVGEVAQSIVDQIEFDVPVVKMMSADEEGQEVKDWNKALNQIEDLNLHIKEGKATYSYKGYLDIIPRQDLPAYTRWWMGTAGDRAARCYTSRSGKKIYNPDYYQVYAPKYNSYFRADVDDLNEAEKASVKAFKNNRF